MQRRDRWRLVNGIVWQCVKLINDSIKRQFVKFNSFDFMIFCILRLKNIIFIFMFSHSNEWSFIMPSIIIQPHLPLIIQLFLAFLLLLRISFALFWLKVLRPSVMLALRVLSFWMTFFFALFQPWFRSFSFSSLGTLTNHQLRTSWIHTWAFLQLLFSKYWDKL